MSPTIKRAIILFIAMFIGYLLFNPYLTSALGGVAGANSAAAAAAVLAVGADFAMHKLWKRKE